jgi:hypothetical protein
MKIFVVAVVLAGMAAPLSRAQEQERPVPSSSARITIPGCARDRRFIVGRTEAHETTRSGIEAGRRFRLNGKKPLLDDIKKQQANMIEVTGLVRRQDLPAPGGVSVGGARISPGPTQPGGGDARRNMGSSDPVIDVESWRPLAEPCPKNQ